MLKHLDELICGHCGSTQEVFYDVGLHMNICRACWCHFDYEENYSDEDDYNDSEYD